MSSTDQNDNVAKDLNYPEWQSLPFRLTKEEIGNPMPVLVRFLETYPLPDHRQMLWSLLSTALGGNAASFIDGKEAGEWVFYCRRLEKLVEAVQVMIKGQNK